MSGTSGNIIYVLGAGADCALGLPVMNNLAKKLDEFTKGEGRAIHEALQERAPKRYWSLKEVVDNSEADLGPKFFGTHPDLAERLLAALQKHPDVDTGAVKGVRLILQQMQTMQQGNHVSEDIVSLLNPGIGGALPISDGMIVETKMIMLTSLIRNAMRSVFSRAATDTATWNAEERSAFTEAMSLVGNFEELLGGFFMGFFTDTVLLQKRYFYLSWLLWAFIKVKAQRAQNRQQSVYALLDDVCAPESIITFNYTNFFSPSIRPTNGYFHGSLDETILFAERAYDRGDPDLQKANTVASIAAYFRTLKADWTTRPTNVQLPAMIPPIAMKPLLCSEYLDKWTWCTQRLREAGCIFVIGYSFAAVDAHFNCLLVNGRADCKIVIFDKSILPVKDNICLVFGFGQNDFQQSTNNGYDALTHGRVSLVEVAAEDITEEMIIAFMP